MLKTNNYLDKRENETKSAVAIVQVDTKMGSATFYIGKSRELIMKGQYYEKVKMDINFDRNRNPFEQAYEFAKGQYTDIRWNNETKKNEEVLLNRPFYGWEDDFSE